MRRPTGAEIAAFVEKKKLLTSTKMDQREACSWVLCYLVRTGVLRGGKVSGEVSSAGPVSEVPDPQQHDAHLFGNVPVIVTVSRVVPQAEPRGHALLV